MAELDRWSFRRRPTTRVILRAITAAAFVLAGVLHFVRPDAYERIIPPALPWARALVAISGLAEIIGGVGLLVRPLRRPAGLGLVALLVAVFPANVYMASHVERFADLGIPAWALWLRLPLQGVLIAWVERISRASSPGTFEAD